MSKNKYLITLWMDWYNYNESILQKFSIEYETTDLNEVKRKLDKIARGIINEGLRQFEDFAVMGVPIGKKPHSVDVNKNNKVIRKECRKIGDGSGHNYIYYDFDIIEVPAGTRLDENLFNLKNCAREVKSFFRDRYK